LWVAGDPLEEQPGSAVDEVAVAGGDLEVARVISGARWRIARSRWSLAVSSSALPRPRVFASGTPLTGQSEGVERREAWRVLAGNAAGASS
jgi:hypothetical protein